MTSTPERQNAETLAASTLLAAAAIVDAASERKGVPRWKGIADDLTAAARRTSEALDDRPCQPVFRSRTQCGEPICETHDEPWPCPESEEDDE